MALTDLTRKQKEVILNDLLLKQKSNRRMLQSELDRIAQLTKSLNK